MLRAAIAVAWTFAAVCAQDVGTGGGPWGALTSLTGDHVNNAPMNAISLGDGSSTVILAGYMTACGGIAASKICRYNFVTRSFTPFISSSGVNGFSSLVYTTIVYKNKIFVGGASGQYYWDATSNQWVPVPIPGGLGVARAYFSLGGLLYIGGNIGATNNVASWDLSSPSASALQAASSGSGVTSGDVHCFAALGATLILGGEFASAGGNVTASGIVIWNPATLIFTPLRHGGNGSALEGIVLSTGAYVASIAVLNNLVYVGGVFIYAAGGTVLANNLARWTPVSTSPLDYSTGTWISLGATAGTNGEVKSLVAMGGLIWVGGTFTNFGGLTALNIGCISGTSMTRPNNIGTSGGSQGGLVIKLQPYGNDCLLVSGAFTTVQGPGTYSIPYAAIYNVTMAAMGAVISPSPLPTPSTSSSVSATGSRTGSRTASASVSSSIEATSSPSQSPSPSSSGSGAPTPSASRTPQASVSGSGSAFCSPTPSVQASGSGSASPSQSPSRSMQASVTATTSASVSATPSLSLSLSLSRTASVSFSGTGTRTRSGSATVTAAATVTGTVSHTVGASSSRTATVTGSGSYSGTSTSTAATTRTPSSTTSSGSSPSNSNTPAATALPSAAAAGIAGGISDACASAREAAVSAAGSAAAAAVWPQRLLLVLSASVRLPLPRPVGAGAATDGLAARDAVYASGAAPWICAFGGWRQLWRPM